MSVNRDRRNRQRWESRSISAVLVRLLALAVPIAASVGVALLIASWLPPAQSNAMLVAHGALVVIPATATLWVVDRVARRFLPLATLLRLSLAFPDQAPSRYAVARLTRSTQELRRRIDEARERGVSDDPSEAAKTILALVTALSLHDRRTRGHSERVRLYTDLLAEELRLSDHDRDRLRWSALVHDIGKLQVPAKVLNKAGKPNEQEWEVLRSHPEEGERLCAALLPWLGEPGRAIVEHHERYDGTGYPKALRGQEISLYGRVLTVADAFEVMTAARAYKRPMSAAEAKAELSRCAGSQFDPAVVRAFLGISLGRLRLAMGPLSWLAQWPVLSGLPRVGATAGQVGGTVAGAAALSTSGWLVPATAEEARSDPPTMTAEEADSFSQPIAAAKQATVAPPAQDEPRDTDGGSDTADDENPAQDETQPPPADEPEGDAQPDHEPAPEPEEDEPDPDDPDPDEPSNPVDELTDDLSDTIDDTSDTLTDTVDDTTDDLTDTADDLLEPLPDSLNDVTDDVTDAVDDTSDALTDSVDDTTDVLTDTLGGTEEETDAADDESDSILGL